MAPISLGTSADHKSALENQESDTFVDESSQQRDAEL